MPDASREAQFQSAAQKMRDFYRMTPGAPIYQREFGYYVLDRWIGEGHLKHRDAVPDYSAYLREVFEFDEPAFLRTRGMGGCEAPFFPEFETYVIEDRGAHELVQDFAGRGVLYFKGRRSGFMPEYVTHPVVDRDSWERNVKWRMDPKSPERLRDIREIAVQAAAHEARGGSVEQLVVGGYMYMRSLIGPGELPLFFYDEPELLRDCMRTWFEVTDAMLAEMQKTVKYDSILLSEDICYKNGALISPTMMKEFLLPYYEQLIQNAKRRRLDPMRPLCIHIDTDGFCDGVIELYREIGAEAMSPFEVAAGSDVVRTGKQYPWLHMTGGIDKRLIAEGGDALKRHLAYIMPAMRARGGYIPTCDHGVPEETPFEKYMEYRALMKEYCR